MSAAPAIPDSSASQPACRPMVSTIITRWWLLAVFSMRRSASVTVATAVSKPKLRSQPAMSLSIVLGTPTKGRPIERRPCASDMVPSPPMTTTTSSPSACTFFCTSASVCSLRKGLALLLVPSTVPPTCKIPDTCSQVSGFVRGAGPIKPSNPSSMPSTSH